MSAILFRPVPQQTKVDFVHNFIRLTRSIVHREGEKGSSSL
jgi:hypothetical protein